MIIAYGFFIFSTIGFITMIITPFIPSVKKDEYDSLNTVIWLTVMLISAQYIWGK